MSVKIKTPITMIALLVMNSCYAATTSAEESVEFNTDVLDAAERTQITCRVLQPTTMSRLVIICWISVLTVSRSVRRKFVISRLLKASARCRASAATCWTNWR